MRGEGSARVWTEKGLDSRSAYAHQHYLAPKHPWTGWIRDAVVGVGGYIGMGFRKREDMHM
jgi:hypothetical protein